MSSEDMLNEISEGLLSGDDGALMTVGVGMKGEG